MKKLIVFGSLLGIFLPALCKGQTTTAIAHFLEKDNIKQDTLIDKTTGVRFIIDKERIYIIAIDKNGKQLWKTDPATNSKLEEYRTKRPIITYFAFSNELKDQVIVIAYNNSQAGYIDKETGKFYFRGQD